MSDGGQPLNVAAEHSADRLGLGLAQLGKLMCHVGDRAVLLAQLLPHGQIAHRGGVTLVGEQPGQDLCRAELGMLESDTLEAFFDEGHPTVRELPDRALASGLGNEPERLRRKVVVLLGEAFVAGLGEGECLGGSTASPSREGPLFARLDRALFKQLIEMAAHGRRSQLEPLGQGCGSGGSVVEDRPNDALTRRLVLHLHEFHNISVPLMSRVIQARSPLPVRTGFKKQGTQAQVQGRFADLSDRCLRE